jgi:hypothetical protein
LVAAGGTIRASALLVGLWLLTSGCASSSVELRDVVTLHGVAPEEAVAGDTIEVKFTLTNTSSEILDLCSPSGVSMWLESPSRTRWLLILHGITTDTECSGPITLQPGEAKTFLERGTIRRNWPSGAAVLVGALTLWCREALRCADHQLEVRSAIQVRRGPGA